MDGRNGRVLDLARDVDALSEGVKELVTGRRSTTPGETLRLQSAALGRELKRRAQQNSRSGVKAVGTRNATARHSRGSSSLRKSFATGHPLLKDNKTDEEYRSSLEDLIQKLRLLPSGSRYAKHRVNCAMKALQLVDQPEGGNKEELEALLMELKL